MTTAASNARSKASISSRVARFTSDPFSSIFTTFTSVGGVGGAGTGCRGSFTGLREYVPSWICRPATVRNARK
jgi:hypothetical protein